MDDELGERRIERVVIERKLLRRGEPDIRARVARPSGVDERLTPGVPASAQALALARAKARDVGARLRTAGEAPALSFPPRLGEHNEKIYGEALGLSAERLAELKQQRIV